MATITISREDIFPEGTEVDAYEAVGLGRTPTSGAPTGTSAGSGTVTDGVLEITGLDSGKAFILYAESPDRYLRASTMTTAAGGGTGDVTTEDLEAAIAAHAAATEDVHGVADTARLVGSVVFDGTDWPEPTGQQVDTWRGGAPEDDPTALQGQGDDWLPASEA